VAEFFQPPKPPRTEFVRAPQLDWMGPPRAVVPALVPIERVVARTDEVAVYLSGFWVYPTGFQFTTHVVTEDEWSELDPFAIDHSLHAGRRSCVPPEILRLGFQFANGSKATNTGSAIFDEEEDGHRPTSPCMSSSGGRSFEGASERTFWVWPLPPPGALEFVCEWPAAEIPLTRVELDATPIIEAASRAQRLFPKP
jgi:hypothetical protein